MSSPEEDMDKQGKILIIEDDPGWRDAVSDILKNANYHVDVVSNIDEVFTKLPQETYSVMIIDLNLGTSLNEGFEGFGILDGINYLAKLSGGGRPIILSAFGGIEQMREAFKRGAYDFIEKQAFNKKEFLNLVEEALGTSPAIEDDKCTEHKKKFSASEIKEFGKIIRQTLRGRPIEFDVPKEIKNPWS